MHSTDNLEDDYLGSGLNLTRSIKKHGKENHKREILEFCNSRNELKSRECEIVNLNEIAKIECMNMVVGGEGGNFISNEQHKLNGLKSGLIHKQRMLNDIEYRNGVIENLRIKNIINMKSGRLPNIQDSYNRTGTKHSEETKQKMRKSKNVGCDNSQYGTCWITNKIENKKIYKGDTIPEGWKLGRKLK